MEINPRAVLLELDRRTKAQSNGALLFFKKAGVTLVNEDEITLQDLKNLQEFQPSIFNELLAFLYPELSETANADGTGSAASNFDWQTLVGGILSGAGTGLINSSSSTVNGELAYAQYQAENLHHYWCTRVVGCGKCHHLQKKEVTMDWMALSNILQGAFDTATGITNTVVGGQNYRKELETNAHLAEINKDLSVNTKTEDSKTERTIITGVVALLAIILAGIFIFKG